MSEHIQSLDTSPRPPHMYLFGKEERFESIDGLITKYPPVEFVKDTVSIIDTLSEREIQDFVDLYAAHAEDFSAQNIKDCFARRNDGSAESAYDRTEDIGLAREIANELQGEINRKVSDNDSDTPLLRILFPR